MRRHHAVGDFHYRVTQTLTDHDLLRNFLTPQTNHGQLDWFDRRPVLLKAQVMFPHLPTKIAVSCAEAEITFRTLMPTVSK